MTDIGIEVPPLSRKEIRQTALRFREALGIRGYFPIVEILDPVFTRDLEGYSFELGTRVEMGDRHGLTIPDELRVIIRDDVYEGACRGKGRDRFTMAHELGHLMLHQHVVFARHNSGVPGQHARFRDSEWQAHTFAGELLIPVTEVQGAQDARDFCHRFGVSTAAADVQWKIFLKEGLL